VTPRRLGSNGIDKALWKLGTQHLPVKETAYTMLSHVHLPSKETTLGR